MAEEEAFEILLANLNRLVSEVETRLTALVGNSSLCLIGQSGRPVNAVKYNEGQYHALKTAKRLVEQKMGDGQVEDIPPALGEAAQKSEQFLTHYQGKTTGGSDWVSYYRGELDGYEAVIALIKN